MSAVINAVIKMIIEMIVILNIKIMTSTIWEMFWLLRIFDYKIFQLFCIIAIMMKIVNAVIVSNAAVEMIIKMMIIMFIIKVIVTIITSVI